MKSETTKSLDNQDPSDIVVMELRSSGEWERIDLTSSERMEKMKCLREPRSQTRVYVNRLLTSA
ncbi:Protein CBG25561 [Caenorhabditis briggsae]|uniref:Protein CBG25561 n=1 Tax=Caenorhabditis briggsae TaxID=6238 RepID=B6IF48_CAEBR|nr:Protein CBG25561 [Caenorhabditis briggsae]CAR98528.1 Protein CBG25561 [Caenorhabditis briggsae]